MKGRGKPHVFKNGAGRFVEWFRKATGFLAAAYGTELRAVLEWTEDQGQGITLEGLTERFVEDTVDAIPDLDEKNSQLHVALLSLTEGESFDIVLGAAPHGFEALRRLIRRWGPLSGGRRRALLRQILVPERAKLADLPVALEKWEELVCRYEKRRAGGAVQTMDDDIKTAALEALVPNELEQHLAMNRGRLPTHGQVRAEIQAYIEARRSQGALKNVVQQTRSPDAMDVASFTNQNGKGFGASKGTSNGGDKHDNRQRRR